MGLRGDAAVSGRAAELLKHRTVALDSNIFIYVLEENENFPVAIELLRLLPKKGTRAFTSMISLIEVTIPSYRIGDIRRVTQAIEIVYGNGLVTPVVVDRTIALKAAQLRARFPKLKTPDAIQLATAILADAGAFITADRDFAPGKIGKHAIDGVAIEVI